MTEATIRTAIYNAVNGVSNVGKVYDYERWANEWGDFLDLFKTTIGSTTQVRGWEVGYRGFLPDEEATLLAGAWVRNHNFVVVGYLGLDDSEATEKTMSALAETVADTIEADSTLDGLSYANVETTLLYETRVFGGVLCHYAEIGVLIGEQITP
jgi:hypothetical protein